MALTSTERRCIDELAGDLARDNPRLARALSGRRFRLRATLRRLSRLGDRRRRVVLSWVALVLLGAAPALLVTGAVLGQAPLLAAGSFTGVSGAALAVVRAARARLRPPR